MSRPQLHPLSLASVPTRYRNTWKVICTLVLVGLIVTIGVVKDIATFRVCFGALLLLLACAQLWVARALFLHRRDSLLELSQPFGLSLFALTGAVATAGSYLFVFPESNIGCSLRQPVILMCVTFMGSMLVAKSWRIGSLVTPRFGSVMDIDNSNKTKATLREKAQHARLEVMAFLSRMVGWSKIAHRRKTSAMPQKLRRTTTFRQKITFADSLRVAAMLSMPQIFLQIINLSVPAIRTKSVDIDDGLYACQCTNGPWMLVIGIIISSVPFFLALLLNVKSDGMPDTLREFNQLATCMKMSISILLITLPSLGMIGNTIPNAHAYLLASSLLSFILPLCYHVAWARVYTIKTNKAKGRRDSIIRSSMAITRGGGDDLETVLVAEGALDMVGMFQSAGRSEKATELSDDILTMFKKDGKYEWETGFTIGEIHSFGPKTLQIVVRTLAGTAKRLTNAFPTLRGEEFKRTLGKSLKIGQSALNIFDQAPAKHFLKDRNVIFSAFSFMCTQIRMGIPSSFEIDIASNFVRESQFQLLHYCRALAMKAEMLKRHQQFGLALAVVDSMKAIYDPELHTASIAEVYGTDHCANVIALSAFWYDHLGHTEQALEVCEEVIQRILPEIGKTNVNNSNMLGLVQAILPIIQVLRVQKEPGSAAKVYALFNTFIMEPFNSGTNKQASVARFPISPLFILLKCCFATESCYSPIAHDDIEFEDDVAWLLGKEGKIPDGMETLFAAYQSVSIYSLQSEACLELAKQLKSSHRKKSLLIEEGLRVAVLTEDKMKDEEGNVINPIVYKYHARVYSDLRSFNETNV